MNIATRNTSAEDEVSPVENEDTDRGLSQRNGISATESIGESDNQLLSDGLIPFGLEDSAFYRDGSRVPQPDSTRLQPTLSAPFYDGLIPVDENEVSPISPTSGLSFSLEDQGPLESNLLGLLGPQHLAAPAPRWAVPPQWLQFQMLRSYDEGLILSERQESEIPLGVLKSAHPDEPESQVQVNLQSLLQRQASGSSDPSPRWEVLPQWIQSSFDEDERSFVRPQAQEFYDGLIAVEGEHSPDLTTRVPVVREPSVTEDERQMQANLLRLIPLDARPVQKPQSARTISPPTVMNGKPPNSSLPKVTCHFGLMQRTGARDRQLEFDTVEFSTTDSLLFSRRLQAQASKSMGLMLLIITDWQLWFLDPLKSVLPDFPIQTLLHLSSTKATTMLPTIDHNEGELSCIMEHINTRDKTLEKPDNETEIDVGHVKAQCLPLVVWTKAENAIDGQPDQPIIVVISRCKRDISAQITGHYLFDDYKRWDRLNGNHAWVYLDLYFLFTKWDRVWGAVKQNLSIRTQEVVHGRNSVMPILEQTRQLHNDNNVMISLREHVRIHKASLKVVKQRVEKMLGGPEWLDTQHLKSRLEDAFELLEYYDVTATTLLEQQQNLLSLAFNLENVAQGQAVARLNALALIFLPLSYVSSIFGITTLTASPKWYPVAAIPVLVSTILIAYAAHKFFTSKPTQASTKPSPSTHSHTQRDIEQQPPILQSKFSRLFSRSNTPSTHLDHQTSYDLNNITVNDPSRLTRRTIDRSLADRNFVPPQSTVQYLPSAYDLSSGMMPEFGAEGMRLDSFASQNGSVGEVGERSRVESGGGIRRVESGGGTKRVRGKESFNGGVLRRPFGFGALDEDPE